MKGRYQVYPTYKEVGEGWCKQIPCGWSVKRTKWLFDIKKRIAGVLGHSILSITQAGIKVKDTESGEGQLSMDYSKYQLVYVGDFAMNHMDLLTGYVDISNFNGVTSPDYRVFCSKNDSTFDKYFLYLFQLAYIKKIYFPLGQGSSHLGRWRLPTGGFYNFRFPVPPKEEQQTIANFLDHETAKIDTLIAKQQQLIKLLLEKRHSVISHAVTKGLNPDAPMKDSGVEWLGEVPAHWEIVPLKYLVAESDGIQMGPFGGMLKDLVETDTGFKVFGQENTISGDFTKGTRWLTKDRFEELLNYKLKVGDIVLTRKGSLGNARFVSELPAKGIIDSDTIRIRIDGRKLQSKLMSFLMHNALYISEQISRNRRGAILPGLNTETISNIFLVVPQPSEQEDLFEYLLMQKNKFDFTVEKGMSAIALLQERRTALISAAVTGKIDVRNWQAPQAETSMEADA